MGIINSYSQIFFSDNKIFAGLLLVVSFADIYAGLAGLMAVVITNITAEIIGFDRNNTTKGIYGFNSLLVGLSLGIYYSPGIVLFVLIALAGILTLFISVSLQGIIGKYGLPFLSLPFVAAAWIMTLGARNMSFLGISERGIFTMNELYSLGGKTFIQIYDWWNSITLFEPLKIYFISLGAILFQFNVLSGIIIAIGLLLYSRIAFSLSIIGFFTAYLFYDFVGADISEVSYSYIGFNYILTSMAVGGFFIIPSALSYMWSIFLVPVTALLSISLYSLFSSAALPIYALPFNIIVLLFLYILKFRVRSSGRLTEVVIQQNSPEKNLYSFENYSNRYRHDLLPMQLPFFGTWCVSQGYDDELTHMGLWKHALDFVILDEGGRQFKNNGDLPEDYFCYNKPVVAPADGFVEFVVDHIEDNTIGIPNIRDNWGNSVVIRHNYSLFSSLSHLKKGSVTVKPGDRVKKGDLIARCGNSGRSPYPHLHFQVQAQPYIGSHTLHYPLSYFIEHLDSGFGLKNFTVPVNGQLVSNIKTNDLLVKAFDLVPGRTLIFETETVEGIEKHHWDVNTNEFNIPYIRCRSTLSSAYFTNDGNMFLVSHYEGKRDTLLYYFCLAAYRVQLGFYRDLVLKDSFPLNLVMRSYVLFFQDFIAPFVKFLRSDYRMKYEFIDNEIISSNIRLGSSSANYLAGKMISLYNFNIDIDGNGIASFRISGEKCSISAKRCPE